MRTLALAVLAALALPATAAAKEVVKVTACGTNGCHASEKGRVIAALMDGGDATGGPPSAAAPGYKVRSVVAEGDQRINTFAVWHIPSLRLMRTEDGFWLEMKPAGVAALARLTRGLKPFPANAIPLGPPVSRGGALPPQTYRPTPAPQRAATHDSGDGGTAWWVYALIGGVLALIAVVVTRSLVWKGGAPAGTR